MTFEFDGIEFPSAAARACFIGMDNDAQQKWRDQHAPTKPSDGVVEGTTPRVESSPVLDHAMSDAEWRQSAVVAEARKLMAHGFQPVLVRPDNKKPPRSYDQDTVTDEADF